MHPRAPLILLPLVLLCAAVSGVAAAAAAIEFDPMRTVQFQGKVDLEAWAGQWGVAIVERLPVAGGGSIVRFEMEEGEWRARRGALCSSGGVIACSTDYCQEYFADDAARTAPDESQWFLVPKAPDIAELVPEQQPVALPTTPVLTETPVLPGPLATPPGAARCPQAAVPGTVTLQRGGNAGTLNMPAGIKDAGCFERIAVRACRMQIKPAAALQDDHEPRRLLALVSGTDGTAPTAPPGIEGLTLLESTPLTALGATLLRFEITDVALNDAAGLARLQAVAGISGAQLEYRFTTDSAHSDPYSWMNYGARLTGADDLHTLTQGAGVTVAVIDTAADVRHPDLAKRIVEQVDVTGFGLTADRHGTAIAGLIAGEADNGVAAYGMAPAASLLVIKACQPAAPSSMESRCWSSTLAKAVDVALRHDTPILNMSLGGPDDPLLRHLIELAISRGRLVIAAAGNDGSDGRPSYPAALSGVLAVTAADARRRLYSAATRGSYVQLAAPGVEVPVLVPGSTDPGLASGTSMASAHVAGVAALLRALAPTSTAAAMAGALVSGGTPLANTPNAGAHPSPLVSACTAAHVLAPTSECAASPPGKAP